MRMTSTRHGRFVRLLVAFLAAFVLMFVPLAAQADDFPGTPDNDVINGTDGNDTINGEGGNDSLRGDQIATPDAGNDTINGGDGNDVIRGDHSSKPYGGDDIIDGGADDDVIYGDGNGTPVGGNDTIHGGTGNDAIWGDGDFEDELIFADGGDDIIFGDAGNDLLFGNSGNDILCGGEGDDTLTGGDGVDLACAVNDNITVTDGEYVMFDLAANDELLNDENLETTPLEYGYATVPFFPFNVAIFSDGRLELILAPGTPAGEYSFDYYVRRATDDLGGFIESIATVLTTVLAAEDPDDGDGDDGDDDGDDDNGEDDSDRDSDEAGEDTDSDEAALPNTGAADNLNLIGSTGIAFIVAGLGLVIATPRRRASTHRA